MTLFFSFSRGGGSEQEKKLDNDMEEAIVTNATAAAEDEGAEGGARFTTGRKRRFSRCRLLHAGSPDDWIEVKDREGEEGEGRGTWKEGRAGARNAT